MINLEKDEAMSRGMAIAFNDDGTITFLPQLIDVIDLSYNLIGKLSLIASIVCKHKNTFINCLSSNDKIILENSLHSGAMKSLNFWNKLLSSNCIRYKDSLFTYLNTDLESIRMYDRATSSHFYKWFNLNTLGEKK